MRLGLGLALTQLRRPKGSGGSTPANAVKNTSGVVVRNTSGTIVTVRQ